MVKWDITRDSGSRVVGSNPARRVLMLLYITKASLNKRGFSLCGKYINTKPFRKKQCFILYEPTKNRHK